MDISYDGSVLVVDGKSVGVPEENAQEIIRAIVDYRIAKREEWEAEQRRLGNVWFACYWRWTQLDREETYSLEEAVQFLKSGSDNDSLSPDCIIRPDGTVIDRAGTWELIGD